MSESSLRIMMLKVVSSVFSFAETESMEQLEKAKDSMEGGDPGEKTESPELQRL